MATITTNDSGAMTLLDGTLPLRPFHPDGFAGSLQADGQQVRVAALACDAERVIALSLVGFDTSIGVVLSRLWSSTAVPFAPAPDWQGEWQGPEQLKRSGERYKQCVAHLERHAGSACSGPAAHCAPHRGHPAPSRPAADGRATLGSDD